MAHTSVLFVCTTCDAQFVKWSGRCLECGAWGTIEESKIRNQESRIPDLTAAPAETISLANLQGKELERIKTGINEFDRVLGGGIVPGSLILLGGEPGIGKSTLILQVAEKLQKVLYASSEESAEQVKIRADRLHLSLPSLLFVSSANIDAICATIMKEKPTLAIIDSIQTVYNKEGGEAGSVSQVRASTVKLLEIAKQHHISICMIGHVTKEGAVAGPKMLEHLVDTVLYLEGDRYHSFRVLRTVKNRFESTDEVGIFEMKENGLQEVANPSAAFLAERGEHTSGSIITCMMEGSRPLLVEVQALVHHTSFGYPERRASGFPLNRLQLLIAVLQKHAGVKLENYNVQVNVVGGITIQEPAGDLAVALAVASAYKDKKLSPTIVAFGEVGLAGEIRSVSHTEQRLKEAERLGFTHAIIPFTKQLPSSSLKIIAVKTIQDLITQAS